ncbi:MAG: non-homologous end-joining DNA ligase [Thermacetogeniaceae bacterium]
MAKAPMPQKIVPMLAKPGRLPVNDGEYGFEMKWDGIRAILYLASGQARLLSRNLLDLTRQYPEVLPLPDTPGIGQLIVDGEIVALGEDGRPSFTRLQNRMGVVSDQKVRQLMGTIPVIYMVFDLLYLDGVNLMDQSYARRKDALKGLEIPGKAWQIPGYTPGNGPAVQAISRRLGLEGVVAKRLDSPYQPGKRTGAWLKIKNQLRQELVIGGWLPGGRPGKSGALPKGIGALMVGYYKPAPEQALTGSQEQQLIYAGKVGTGFTDLALEQLERLLPPLRQATSPFQQAPALHPNHPEDTWAGRVPALAGAVFVEPRLVCEVEFTQWTPHGTLRHPSFKGLRSDKNPREVVREA